MCTQCPSRRSGNLRVRSSGRRVALAAVAIIAAPAALYGCGEDEGATPTLTWYINPDNGGQADLAAKCGAGV